MILVPSVSLEAGRQEVVAKENPVWPFFGVLYGGTELGAKFCILSSHW